MPDSAVISLSSARISEIGMRETNQDRIGDASSGALSLFVVADGAGGHAAGEIASSLVVEAMLGAFREQPAFGRERLQDYAGAAVARVARDKLADTSHADMSATVAALLVDGASGQALWAHLGDTRIYLFRGGRLEHVSKDHSLTQQLIDAGYAKAEQLREHPQRSVLYAAVGAEGDTPLAMSDGAVRLRGGDALLLCTDGLWEWVLEADMEHTLATAANSEAWLAAMCRIAQASIGGSERVRDNFSAYAICVEETAA